MINIQVNNKPNREVSSTINEDKPIFAKYITYPEYTGVAAILPMGK